MPAHALPALDLSDASEVAGFWPDELGKSIIGPSGFVVARSDVPTNIFTKRVQYFYHTPFGDAGRHCPSFVEEPLLAVRRHRRQIGLKMRALNSGVSAVALDELADQLCSSDN